MRNGISVMLLAGLALSASPTSAQEINGAVVRLGYNSVDVYASYQSWNGFGAVDIGFGGNWGVQLGAGAWDYSSDLPGNSYEAHLYFAPAQNTKIGVFGGVENWSPYTPSTTFPYYGVEIAYENGPVSGEVFVEKMADQIGFFEATIFAISGAYKWDGGISAIGGFTQVASNFSTFNRAYVGAGYSLGERTEIEATVGYGTSTFLSSEGVMFGFGVNVAIGDGVSFGPRNWVNSTGGY